MVKVKFMVGCTQRFARLSQAVVFAGLALLSAPVSAEEAPVYIGLDADMSSSSAQAGAAIQRGAQLAIAEINSAGGLLGRPVELVVRDHRGNPARGLDNIAEFATMPGLLAVIAGLHTPVALHELESIHNQKIPFLVAWAAGTPIVDNPYSPNFVFRVSVRDQFAGGFFVESALSEGHERIGLLLERTGWGRSNEKAVRQALSERGLEPAAIEWFNWGVEDLSPHIKRLREAGTQDVILVANPPEGLVALRSMAALPAEKRLPIISHWGITGGTFGEQAGDMLSAVDLRFLQTFSFNRPPLPERGKQLFEAHLEMFPDMPIAARVPAQPGIAHAYDLVNLLALAVNESGTLDRSVVRDALEQLPDHRGVMRDYAPAFTPERHDALDVRDFILARYDADGVIVPTMPSGN